jgi:hypothetical protein
MRIREERQMGDAVACIIKEADTLLNICIMIAPVATIYIKPPERAFLYIKKAENIRSTPGLSQHKLFHPAVTPMKQL